MTKNIEWLGHASFRITSKDGKVIYIDPWKLKTKKKADLILITHDHYDHLSPEDVEKISQPGTEIVTTPDGAGKLKGKVKTVKPGDKIKAAGFEIQVIPAYNTKADRQGFHPKDKNWVGYIVTVDGVRIYHPGDTDLIPEMTNLKPEVAFIPCGGTYTMDWKEAIDAAQKIAPKVLIPMHWGDIVGTKQDAQNISKIYMGEVKILEIVSD
ncbi:MAG: MBL fold metallo-hydrolase [Proteobacteria bacterium]|nr:MBL fold metallo-hydrolase [Pseudomonadota bacterium]